MKVKEPDLMEIKKWFEDSLSRLSKVDRKDKMRMRRKIRDELFLLLTWENPTPIGILNRWEERLGDVFKVLPYGLKEDLWGLLVKKMANQ